MSSTWWPRGGGRTRHEDRIDRDHPGGRRVEELALRPGPYGRRPDRPRRRDAERLHQDDRGGDPRAGAARDRPGSDEDPRALEASDGQRLARRRPYPPHRDRRDRGRLLGHPREVARRPDPPAPGRPRARLDPGLRERLVPGRADAGGVPQGGEGRGREGPEGAQARSVRHRAGLHRRGRARPRLPHRRDAAAGIAAGIQDPDRRARALHRDGGDPGGAEVRAARHLLVGGAHDAGAGGPGERGRGAVADPGRDRRDVRHGGAVLYPRRRRRREYLPAGAHVARRNREYARRRPSRAGPWQLDRPAPERRPRRDGRLPPARRLRAELPHPGALRSLQRAVDEGARDLGPADRRLERAPVAAGAAGSRRRSPSGGRPRASVRSGRVPQHPPGRLGAPARAAPRPPLREASGRAREGEDLMREAVLARVRRRIIPFLLILYVAAYLDRINVGFAALEMKKDLGLSDAVYGLGAGLFFVGYFLFEVPSNLILERVGARRWIARIMVTW